MKTYITTSNSYVRLIPEMAARLNRYWPDQDVTILGFDVAPPEFPKNFKFHSLGVQADFGRSWTDPLKPFFESIDDEYFVLLLDDYFLTAPVDTDKVAFAEARMKEGVEKFDLSDDRSKEMHSRLGGGVIESDQKAPYRVSLQAGIWNRRYFLKYLKPSRDAWHFECDGYKEAFNDGAKVLGFLDAPMKYENKMLKGEEKA